MRPKKQRSKAWKHGRAERRGKGEAGSGLAARWEGARPARGRSRGKLPHGSPSSARGEGLLQTWLDSEQFILFFFFILFLIKSFSEPQRGRYPEESGKYPAGAGSGACPYQAAAGKQTVALRADNRARFQRPKRAPARAELRAPTHPAHTPAYTPASLGLGVPAGAGRQRLGAGPGGGARLRRREVRALPSPGWIWAEQGEVSCGGSAGRHWALDMEGVVS